MTVCKIYEKQLYCFLCSNFLYSFAGNCDFNAVSELRSLKSRLEELESDLRDRDEEIGSLKDQTTQLKSVNGDDSDIVKVGFIKHN